MSTLGNEPKEGFQILVALEVIEFRRERIAPDTKFCAGFDFFILGARNGSLDAFAHTGVRKCI